jgi:hypothetical protein
MAASENGQNHIKRERLTMERDCVICGTGFVARNSRRRFCSDRCRKRAVRGGFGATVSAAEPRTPSGPGEVEQATGEALRAVGRLGTPLGQVAVVLARRLDHPGADTGSALSAVARQLQVAMEAVTADVRPAMDPLDELRARRDRKLGLVPPAGP